MTANQEGPNWFKTGAQRSGRSLETGEGGWRVSRRVSHQINQKRRGLRIQTRNSGEKIEDKKKRPDQNKAGGESCPSPC